jgi:hypothetical protein
MNLVCDPSLHLRLWLLVDDVSAIVTLENVVVLSEVVPLANGAENEW